MDEMQSEACQKLLTEALLFRSLPMNARTRLLESARDSRRFIRRGSTLAVESLPARFCWNGSQAFFVELPADSLPANPGGSSAFTEQVLFEGNPYQVEFVRGAYHTLGAFLHVLKKVPRSKLPSMKTLCLHAFPTHPHVEPQWCHTNCAPPASGPVDRYGSDDILQAIRWSFVGAGWQIFRGEGRDRVASICVALSRSG